MRNENVLTRWGTWISAANNYVDNYEKVREVIEGFEDVANLAIPKAKEALNNRQVTQRLTFVKAHFGGPPDLIEKLETRGLEVTKAAALLEELREKSKDWPGLIGEKLRKN